MFKVGDTVSFDHGVNSSGRILLIGENSLLVRVGIGKGHDGLNLWTEALGWERDKNCSCWFVGRSDATVVKGKPSFKGNVK